MTSAMPYPQPASDDGLSLNYNSLRWGPAMLTGMSVSRAMMRMWMRRNQYQKLLPDECRKWSIEGIVLEGVKIGLYMSDA